jgi:putative protein kinase ArgK-like GTPase of G3E family
MKRPESETVVKTVALADEGIHELVSAIETQLLMFNRQNAKKVHLLADKAWQIISAGRMSDIKKDTLFREISESVSSPDFNLYKYADKYRVSRNNV